MVIDQPATFRRYRAPQGDGETLIDPSRSELATIVASNRRQLSGVCYDVAGRCLSELSTSARRGLLDAAIRYTGQYRSLPESITGLLPESRQPGLDPRSEIAYPKPLPPFVFSGHQPQLFHPGVWYKNFVLGSLAKEVNGVGVHLSIDSDLCRSAAIRVPAGSAREPRLEVVSFDLAGPAIPYEERLIRDRATFRQFGVRVKQMVACLVDDPLIDQLWPLVVEQADHCPNVGTALAQGRHRLEAAWRNETLELPQSVVCQLPEFAWFIVYLLINLPRFRQAYNRALAAYRQAHRLRNRAHPVPDLHANEEWMEAPLWMWTADDPERRPLFARRQLGRLTVSDGGRRRFDLPLLSPEDAGPAVDRLLELAEYGIKIRTRALATTLFARLVLSDIFLHGIGGAKYDQVTDLIAKDFFGFELPKFAAVSATLRLPIERPTTSEAAASTCRRKLRELEFHPEQFLEQSKQLTAEQRLIADDWARQKRRWIATPKTSENARERHLAISAANAALQPFVAAMRRRIEENCQAREENDRRAAILDSREYSFCLHPTRHFQRLL
jgi:hypothetical protein